MFNEFISNLLEVLKMEVLNIDDIWKEFESYQEYKEEIINEFKLSNESFELVMAKSTVNETIHSFVILNESAFVDTELSFKIEDFISSLPSRYDFKDGFMSKALYNAFTLNLVLPKGVINSKQIKEIQDDAFFHKKNVIEYSTLKELIENLQRVIQSFEENILTEELNYLLLTQLPIYFKTSQGYKVKGYNVELLENDKGKYILNHDDLKIYENFILNALSVFNFNLSKEEFNSIEYVHEYETLKLEGYSKSQAKILYHLILFLVSLIDSKQFVYLNLDVLGKENLIIKFPGFFKLIKNHVKVFNYSDKLSEGSANFIIYKLSKLGINHDY